MDLENRAYYMTISIQRWLAIRLDFFGNVLILGIALFAAGYRFHVNPSKIGVILSYTLGSKSVTLHTWSLCLFLLMLQTPSSHHGILSVLLLTSTSIID